MSSKTDNAVGSASYSANNHSSGDLEREMQDRTLGGGRIDNIDRNVNEALAKIQSNMQKLFQIEEAYANRKKAYEQNITARNEEDFNIIQLLQSHIASVGDRSKSEEGKKSEEDMERIQEEMKTKLAEKEVIIEALEVKLKKTKEELDDIILLKQGQIEDSKAACDSLLAKVALLERENADVKAKLQTLKQRNSELEEEKHQCFSRQLELGNDNDILKEKLNSVASSYEAKIQALTAQHDLEMLKIKGDMDSTANSTENGEETAAKTREELAVLKNKVEDLAKEKESLKEAIVKMNQESAISAEDIRRERSTAQKHEEIKKLDSKIDSILA